LTGCASKERAEKSGDIKIVTSFYPMYIAAINVARDVDGVAVENMAGSQTGCLHDYQLTTEDLKKLEKADVFIVNGAGMESFLDKAVKAQPKLKVVDASRGIELINDAEGDNPHVWVSVTDAMRQVDNITEELAAIDEKNADKYKKNAKDYIEKLSALKSDMHRAIDPLPDKRIITFHEAFLYFAKEFDLKIIGVIEREPGAEPSPKELKETIELVKKEKIKAIFAEPQYSKSAADTIAKEGGAKVYTLDPVVSGTDDGDYDAYINIMQKNKEELVQALRQPALPAAS
jgi:zinc transport system substrate-binding protein